MRQGVWSHDFVANTFIEGDDRHRAWASEITRAWTSELGWPGSEAGVFLPDLVRPCAVRLT